MSARGGGANFAWGDDLPTPVYTQNFESASTTVGSAGSNFGITGATLTGSGSIKTGDALFGTYYQNMADDATVISTRANYLTIADATTWNSVRTGAATSHAFSISFWVNAKVQRTKNFDSYWGALFTGYTSAGGTTTTGIWTSEELAAHPFGPALCTAGQFRYYNGADITDNMDSYRDAIVTWCNNDSWHHFSFVFSNLNQQTFTITCYLDGVQKYSVNETASTTGIEILNNIDRFTIGGSTPHWNDPDNAYAYDEIAIYDQALTAEQVTAIVNTKGYKYTVKAVDGSSNELKVLTSGQNSPDATISYAYPRYINVNGTLYKKDAGTGSNHYQDSFSLTSDNQVEEVTYTASSYTGVLYFNEAEDVISSTSSGDAGSLCSNMAGGYASSATKITTLPAGTYTIYFGAYASNSTHLYFYKNSESGGTIKDYTGTGSWEEANTGKFTLTKATDIMVEGGTSDGYVFDYFIITGTPSYTVLGDPYYSNWGAYGSNLSNKVTLAQGQSYSYKFTNYNHTTYNWDNYIVPVYDGATLKYAIRADFWEDVAGANTGCEANIVWGNFNSDMNGATIDMNISYTSDKLIKMQANITTSSSSKWFYNYTSPSALTAEEVKVALGANWCWLEVIKEGGAIATMNALGYTTFSSINKLNLDKLPDGLTAYYAASGAVDDDVIRLTKATGVVPGETGLILKGTANTVYEIPTSTGATTALTGNLLVGCPYRTTIGTDKNKYVLVKNGGTMEFQSLADHDATMPTGKAYLNAGTSSGARLTIVFDEGTSAIKDMDASIKHGVLVEGKFLEEGKMVIVKNGMKFNANGQKVK